MKIALLLSGRVTRYKECLIPLLYKTNHDIDIFISVNDDDSEFYDNLKNDLKKWLKDIYIKKYEIPEDFNNTQTRKLFKKIGRENDVDKILLHSLSWYYNDTNVFNMAKNYADKNNFEYDIYFRTRSEIISYEFPNFIKGDKLYCSIPVANYKLSICDNVEGEFIDRKLHAFGELKFHNKDVIAEIAYGNRKNMEYYCSTYEYVLRKNKELNGNLFVCLEVCITMNINDKTDNYEFFKYTYDLDPLRK